MEYRQSRSGWELIKQQYPNWEQKAQIFLTKGYYTFGGADGNLYRAACDAFKKWLDEGANEGKLPKPRVLKSRSPTFRPRV